VRFFYGASSLALQIKDLTEELNLHWNKLSCPSSNNSPFWNHEWSKHGTCSGLTEHAYFKTALNLYNTYNLTAALASAGENLDLKLHYNLCPHILISQWAKIELLARSTVSSFVP
jgi:ribonuclease I